ncbi:MAG: hypothetical protein WDN76_00095 [Alphaproteobacteria bacterium]
MSAITDLLATRLPPRSWTADPELIASHLVEWRGVYHGKIRIHGDALDPRKKSPQLSRRAPKRASRSRRRGGNTGLVGGQTSRWGNPAVAEAAEQDPFCLRRRTMRSLRKLASS